MNERMKTEYRVENLADQTRIFFLVIDLEYHECGQPKGISMPGGVHTITATQSAQGCSTILDPVKMKHSVKTNVMATQAKYVSRGNQTLWSCVST